MKALWKAHSYIEPIGEKHCQGITLPTLTIINNLHTVKKLPAVEAVPSGCVDAPSAIRAQRPNVPGVALGAVKATAPAPVTFGL